MQMLGFQYVFLTVAESFAYSLIPATVSTPVSTRRGHSRDFISKFLLYNPRYRSMDAIWYFLDILEVV